MAAFVRELLRAQTAMPIEHIEHVVSQDDALAALTGVARWDAVIVDLHLPDGDGVALIDVFALHAHGAALIVITADPDIDVGVESLRHGAAEFLPKSELTVSTLARCLRFALERQRFQAQLRSLADTDELTGVANRRGLGAHYQRAAAAAHRSGGQIMVAMFDVNDFKRINDTMGHGVGDQVLARIADGLRHTVRAEDLVARIGGDEFVVCAVVSSDDDAAQLRERLREHALGADPSGQVAVQLAVGITEAVGAERLETVLARADAAMYREKGPEFVDS